MSKKLLEKFKVIVFEFSDIFTPESFSVDLTPFKNSTSKFLNVLFERTRDLLKMTDYIRNLPENLEVLFKSLTNVFDILQSFIILNNTLKNVVSDLIME